MDPIIRRIPTWFWILFCAALLYAGALPWFYVGAFNDDAAYVSMARALWHGTYREPYFTGQPPMTVYPPGYPLFLMPFVAAVGTHWELLKLTSLALGLANVVLAWHLFGLFLSPKTRLWALAFFALSPVTVIQSGAMMSESLMTTCLLGSFLLFHRVLSQTETGTEWGLAGLVGYAGLVRSAGLLLTPAIVIGFLYCRRSKAAIKVLLGASVMVGGWGIRTYLVAHEWSGYVSSWISIFSDYATTPWATVHNINRVVFAFLSTLLPGLDLPYSKPGYLVTGSLAGLVLYLFGLMLASARAAARPVRSMVLAMAFLCGEWFIVHAFWTTASARYALPILPLVIGLLAGGISFWIQKGPARFRPLGLAVLIVLSAYYLYSDLGAIRRAARPEPLKPECPRQTFAWIRSQTSESAVLQTPKCAETYLYTGRVCAGLMIAQDAEHYRYSVLRSSAAYVLARPMRMPSSVDLAWLKNQEWAASWPEAFRPLYRNTVESTVLYEVVPNPGYLSAYEWYRKAKEDLSASHLASGLQKLNKALALYPHLSSALNAYGAALLIQGNDLPLAKSKLRAAIEIRPHYALALVNLARIYQREGQKEQARKCFKRAEEAIAATGEFADLRPLVVQELQSQ